MRRARLAFALAIVVPLGFLTKFYRAPADDLVNNYLGGVLYEVFWVFAVLLLRPAWPVPRVAAGVSTLTCALEFLQ